MPAIITAQAAPEPDYEGAVREALHSALERVGVDLVADARSAIASRTAPDGTVWPPRKDGTPADLTSIGEDLEATVEGEAVRVSVTGESREFASVHQFGNAHSPRRAFLPIDASGNVELPPAVEERTRAVLLDAVLGALRSAKAASTSR